MFGLAWNGDGATIKQMLLMNKIVLCGEEVPVVASICICTDCMVDGKKKDAEFIGIFSKKRWKSGIHHTITLIVFFDGAANVQKAGEILSTNYPRALCFHGEEHVLSLFFKVLSKLKPIKVNIIFCF